MDVQADLGHRWGHKSFFLVLLCSGSYIILSLCLFCWLCCARLIYSMHRLAQSWFLLSSDCVLWGCWPFQQSWLVLTWTDCVLWGCWPFQWSWLVLTWILTVYCEYICHSSEADCFLPEFWLCTMRMLAIPVTLTGSYLSSDCTMRILAIPAKVSSSYLDSDCVLWGYWPFMRRCEFLPEFLPCIMRILAIPAKMWVLTWIPTVYYEDIGYPSEVD